MSTIKVRDSNDLHLGNFYTVQKPVINQVLRDSNQDWWSDLEIKILRIVNIDEVKRTLIVIAELSNYV